ncbi:short coiled-coil protein, partial [Lecanoromycetidae sp. Uapishka_2]
MASSQTSASTSTSPSTPTKCTPVPSVAEPTTSTSNDDTTTTTTTKSPKNLTTRPPLGTRKSSGTMIVPADHPELEIKDEVFPPTDARAMSPRRSSAEQDRMIGAAKLGMQSQALGHQNALSALVERIEIIKSDHDTLERNNSALQDYIGGLTRSMSKTALDTGRKK